METNRKRIDLDYLKEISNGSNEFVYQMISVFTEEIPGEIDNLEKHLQNKDWKSLRATAHKMKPSYSFMGVKELEEMVHNVEEFSDDESGKDQLPGLIQNIRKITEEVFVELQKEKKNFE
jgi:HPt (histidine-containing phosphotransfer) domain-containing protein